MPYWKDREMSTLSPFFLSLLIVLLPTFSLQFASSLTFVCNENDSATLLKLKKYFNAPHLDNWSNSSSCCFWTSITCDDNGRVTRVGISGSSVSGPIPPEIADLPELRRLNLEANPNLTGPIPESFTKLQHLEQLTISEASLSGTIPTFLCNFTHLNYIDLRSNKLCGHIPNCFSGSVYYVDFSSNHLSGHIPESLVKGYGGTDTFFRLDNNRLTGRIPRSFDKVNFHIINLAYNRFIGDASVLFGKSKLTQISNNRFHFDLSKRTYPEFLDSLDISHNKIRGSINKQIIELLGIGVLDMSYNRLCGEIPSGLWMRPYPASVFEHNKCLCGKPLPPCP